MHSHSIIKYAEREIAQSGYAVLPPIDVEEVLSVFSGSGLDIKVTMLDPWYNKGYGGIREDYIPYIVGLLKKAGQISPNVFLWGFPEVVAHFIERIPSPLHLNTWLTWYYKNNPSVIRGWRSAQMTCLHLTRDDAILYPEHFFNEKQIEKKAEGKLRYVPGPPSVIETSLLCGFVGREEQTGHPSQKPEKVYEVLYNMTTNPGDIVLDPMCGSGTTCAVGLKMGFYSILNDINEEYTQITKNRAENILNKNIHSNQIALYPLQKTLNFN